MDENVNSKSALRDAAEDQVGRSPDTTQELKEKTPEEIIHELQVEIKNDNDEGFNVESWSYYTQLIAHAENTTIDQMLFNGHGNVNAFWVGEDCVSSNSISSYSDYLTGIGSVMSSGAQLQLWECLIAGNLDTDGQNAIDARHTLTDVANYTHSTVFASSDISNKSGDWTLEFGVDPSGNQVSYLTLVDHIYDDTLFNSATKDPYPFGENPPGSLDVTFGGDGIVITDFGDYCCGSLVVIQSDGKIVAAGTVRGYGGFALARYNVDGSLDATFDHDGKVLGDGPRANSMAIDANGKIVVASDSYLARYWA